MNRIFNEARMAYQGQILTAKEMATLLSDMPNSTSTLFITVLVKHNALKRVGKGQYMFPATPVHHLLLEKAMDEIRERQRGYSKKYNDKKHAKSEKSDIQKAIKLLLSTGEYEVFKVEKVVTIKRTQL